jgi:hypothetical protein
LVFSDTANLSVSCWRRQIPHAIYFLVIFEFHISGQTRELRCGSQYFRACAVRFRYFFGFFHGLRTRWAMFSSEILVAPVGVGLPAHAQTQNRNSKLATIVLNYEAKNTLETMSG